MAPVQLIRALLQQASEQGSRSTVLKPLSIMMSVLLAGGISASYLHSPSWVIVLLMVFAALTMALFLFAYIYCMFKDRDALRSETYSIQKLAIEKGFVGDSMQGTINLRAPGNADLLAESSKQTSEDGNV